ncbi:MAG: nucleotidyl transferase AbiEii/AbiGii toxin family protein [Methylotenera sp.]
MDKVAKFSQKDRSDLFAETASTMRTTPAIVEKDFWVVWVLSRVFANTDLARILKFKGGTSLSKVFGLIGRFSEDIDLILDWREVVHDDPEAARSKSQQMKFNEATNAEAISYIDTALLPQVQQCVGDLCSCSIDVANPHAINIRYPAAFGDAYLRPEILLEIGPLASWLPSDVFAIQPYAAQHFPRLFEKPSCVVPTILAERTFWEKATILHQEAHRGDKPMPPRYSRHYYDLARLALSDVKNIALADLEMLAAAVAFKQRFYPSAWAQYELAKPPNLKLIPPEARASELAKDYQAMQNMIFDKPLSFDEVMQTLTSLEKEINALGSAQWRQG